MELYHAGDMETFYATIVEKRGNDLLVEGMEENDINFRGGLFLLDLEAGTEVTWRGTEISVGDLDGGDHISVTFSGSIAESYPARIRGSMYVKLLDDEM